MWFFLLLVSASLVRFVESVILHDALGDCRSVWPVSYDSFQNYLKFNVQMIAATIFTHLKLFSLIIESNEEKLICATQTHCLKQQSTTFNRADANKIQMHIYTA